MNKKEAKDVRLAVKQNRGLLRAIKTHPEYKQYATIYNNDCYDLKQKISNDINNHLKYKTILNVSNWTYLNIDIMRTIIITADLLILLKQPWREQNKETTVFALTYLFEMTERSAIRLYDHNTITHFSIDGLVSLLYYWWKFNLIKDINSFMQYNLIPNLKVAGINPLIITTLNKRVKDYAWFNMFKKNKAYYSKLK